MPNANVVELEACMNDCIAYCEANPNSDFVEYFHPQLARAVKKFKDSIETSDAHYRAYAQEAIEDKMAWKALARELKSTQRYLARVNAVGFPDETVLHWDVELLQIACAKMRSWLKEHLDDIEEGSERLDKLERLEEIAEKERFQRDETLDDYSRQAQFRGEAFGTLGATLTDFRKAMRRSLGKHHEDYKAIRWPFTLAPD